MEKKLDNPTKVKDEKLEDNYSPRVLLAPETYRGPLQNGTFNLCAREKDGHNIAIGGHLTIVCSSPSFRFFLSLIPLYFNSL